ncbi:CLUMA_CG018348, isoform A [Clunio marinus]|uniref:CLUMA_CG018348, isoform A n=1 Tax=Clunio marinus TaxID=568069 RepID=A0A1J1IYY8_9DIPT|nr:CLUMA_CG018348, isoform A [Clunio marinus]
MQHYRTFIGEMTSPQSLWEESTDKSFKSSSQVKNLVDKKEKKKRKRKDDAIVEKNIFSSLIAGVSRQLVVTRLKLNRSRVVDGLSQSYGQAFWKNMMTPLNLK